MTFLQFVLLCAALSCSLVSGLLLAFAIVVMPGIAKLDDREFIRAFRLIDGVIQNNQPAFVFLWVGSVVTVLAAAVLGIWQLRGSDRLLIVAAALVYLVGVQAPTARINVPLNNQLQKLDLDSLDESTLKRARDDFEGRWNGWNRIRTACSVSACVLLLIALMRV
jgi:uncharacterized membrane protein